MPVEMKDVGYFPVFSRQSELRFARFYCEVVSQIVQVRVNAKGVVVSCSLAMCGCSVFKGAPAPYYKKCLIGGKGGRF